MNTQIKDYIDKLPAHSKTIMEEVRALVHKLVPEAEECMSYGVPAFKLSKKNLLMYAAFKAHLGIYPEPATIKKFAGKLESYETSEGTIRFRLDEPIPYDLIGEIVQYRSSNLLKGIT